MSRSVLWDDQRIFLAVLQSGSLAGAARSLGISHPTARARIAALEGALGTTLFTRSVNGLSPTDHALELGAAVRTMAAASDLFIRQAAAPAGALSGIVRLSASDFMAIEVLPPILTRLRASHPGVRIELVASNRVADLLVREVDIAIRNTPPVQAALVAQKLPALPLGLFASKGYLAARGVPKNLEDLADHDLIGPDRNSRELALADALGPTVTRTNFVLRTDSHPVVAAAVRAGIGIGVMQTPAASLDPSLRHVLPGFVAAQLNTWVVTHEDMRELPRIRAVFDALVAGISVYSDQSKR
ncbi:LysR family transcriptional regulator [Ensifer sp. ENS06]|uniref:LysR family transcriptional regulator n=1 Tax=Ensifer sp. ENS06 TaxID=2769276 RepID=UPI000DE077F3|nr:LysR family transcriptional regulator [Ensifer sp. ENS06]MBD9626322.1 LysR family transcriptional regulator [Ensifer sp. ENS06]